MPLTPHSWPRFLSRCAGGLGTLLLSSGLITWIAANWWHWPVWWRLGLVQAVVLICLVLAWRLQSWQNKFHADLSVSSLLSSLAAVAVGGLLALIGQIYQTGADPWQLFALWALLIMPLVVTVRSLFLSLLQIVVLNLALLLYGSMQAGDWVEGASLFACLVLNLSLWVLVNTVYCAREDNWRVLSRVSALCIFGVGLGLLVDYPASAVTLGFVAWFFVQRYWRYDPFVAILSLAGAHIALFVLFFMHIDALLSLFLVLGMMVFWLLRWRAMLPYLRSPTHRIPQTEQVPNPISSAQPAVIDTEKRAEVSSDLTDSWYVRLFKLGFILVLVVVAVAYLALSLGLDETAFGWLGLLLLAASPFLVSRASKQSGVGADLLSVVQVLGLVLYSGVSLYGDVYPFSLWLACALALVWSVVLYRLPGQTFLLRCILAVWGIGASLVWLGEHDPSWLEIWSWRGMGTFCLVSALVLGHGIYRRGWHLALWSPLCWVLLLLGLYWQHIYTTGFPGLSESLDGGLSLYHVMPFLPAAVLLFYWPLHRSASLGQWIAIGGVLALCFFWSYYWLVTAALTCLLVGHAWRKPSMVVLGLFSLLYGLGRLYYYMPISLNYKAYVLLSTGLGLVLMAALGGYVRLAVSQRSEPSVPKKAHTATTIGVVLCLVASLATANTLIYQKESVLRSGKSVVLELMPVDPRSLMQGDYMALRFHVQQQVQDILRDMPTEQSMAIHKAGQTLIMLTPNEDGVFGLRAIQVPDAQAERYFARDARYENKDNWPDEAVVMRVKSTGGAWSLGTDAWFFPEGRAYDFDQARYGLFKVNARGVSVLTEMLNDNLQAIGRLQNVTPQ